jgi:hypothetical protein
MVFTTVRVYDNFTVILYIWPFVQMIQGSRTFFRLFDNHSGEFSTAL